MTKKTRFSEKTKREIANRAGHVCSHPRCNIHTSGPSAESSSAATILGEAAHIYAASFGQGARRRDPTKSDEWLRSTENGIWLCCTHHKEVDSDEVTYTPELLREWKSAAEERAKNRQEPGETVQGVSRLFNLPRNPTKTFVGRNNEISDVTRLLRDSEAVSIYVSIGGPPGIGKTELALQAAYRLALDGSFPGGVFWLSAEDPDLMPTWGGVVADGLDIRFEELGQRATLALREIDRRSEPVLVVLDNVSAWNSHSRPKPLPNGTHVRYLVTTQLRNLGGAGFQSVRVGILDDGAVAKLLTDLAGRELTNDPNFGRLIEHLGGHTLAVELAGAFLGALDGETPTSYLAEIRGNGGIEAEAVEYVGYSRTVEQCFEASWNRLDDMERDAWRLAACFGAEPVAANFSDSVGLDPRGRRKLIRLHLIETDAEGRWSMHRLIREFGRQAGDEEALIASQAAFVIGCQEFVQQIDSDSDFRPYLANRAHLDAAVALAPVVLGSTDERVTFLLDSVGTWRQSLGDFTGARDLLERALALGLESPSAQGPTIARRRSRLAMVLKDLGELEQAQELLKQALKSELDSLREQHIRVASRRSQLAGVFQDLGELEQARDLFEKALDSDVDSLGEQDPRVAAHRTNLAGVLRALGEFSRAEGELSRARDLFEQALEWDLKNLDPLDTRIASRRSNLAMVLKVLGELARAQELLEEALDSDIENFGENHPRVAARRSLLGGVLQDMGNQLAARDLFDLSLTSDLKNLDEDHPTIAVHRSNLAGALQALGEYSQARDLLRKALASDIKNFGELDHRVATRRSNLARVLWDMGEFSESRDLLERALDSDLRSLGEDHPRIALRRAYLAGVLGDLGEVQLAKRILEQGLLSALENPDDQSLIVGNYRSSLARLLQSLGELSRARDLSEQALASDLKTFGAWHPRISARQTDLAGILKDLGELSGARDLLEQALASTSETLGDHHPSVLVIQSNLAGVLQDLGELSRARDLLENALDSSLKNLGEQNPRVAERQSNLAMVLKDFGELRLARDLLDQALASDLESFGEQHPRVGTRRSNLGLIFQIEGNHVEAEIEFRQSLEALRDLGADHPQLALTKARFAKTLEQLGDRESARANIRAALGVVAKRPEESTIRAKVEKIAKSILGENLGSDTP